MKSRMTCYETVLYTLLHFNYATRKSLMLLNFSDIAIYTAIQRGLREKTISTSTIRYRKKKGEKHHVLTYLTITASGIRFLADHSGNHIPWLRNIPHDISRVRIRGVRCAMPQVERFTRMAIAGQLAMAAGAEAAPMYLTTKAPKDTDVEICDADSEQEESVIGFDDGGDGLDWWLDDSYEGQDLPDGKQSGAICDNPKAQGEPPLLLSAIVAEAIRKTEAMNRDTKEDIKMVFHSSRDVKSALSATIRAGDSTLVSRDLMICRYSGLLESCSNSVLMYVPNAMGMDWRERIVRKELATQLAYSRLYSKFGPIHYDRQHGIVIVQNEKMLEDIFFDRQGRRGENEVIGRSFNRFYVITLDKNGVSDLRAIMTRDLETERTLFIQAAIQSGLYESNTKLSAELFPLRSQDGMLISIGIYMDLVQVAAIESLANHLPTLSYGVLCKPHQLPYYQRIMPKANFMLVE